MDFIHLRNIPTAVKECRQKISIFQDVSGKSSQKTILYRAQIFIDLKQLGYSGKYLISGVKTIIRFNFTIFLKSVANLEFTFYHLDNEHVFVMVKRLKLYFIIFNSGKNLLRSKRKDEIAINRKGKHSIENVI